MSGTNYTSREPYAAQPIPLTARGPDPRAASLVSDTLSQNLAHVSQQFIQLWGALGQAQTINAASGATAKATMKAIDMEKGFAVDPDPSTVPQRFPEAAAKLRAETLDGLDPAVAGHVARAFDTQIMPNTYRQVIGIANQRHIGNLRGAEAETRGSQAQNFAVSSGEAQGHILGALKAGIAGSVAAGIYNQADAAPLLSHTLVQAITIRAAGTDPGAPLAAQAMLDRFKGDMTAGDVAALTTSLRGPVERATGEGVAVRNIQAATPGGNINDAIQAQESGGRDGLVSIDGARGRMQIMPGTWAQYARPGEKIDNPTDNQAVGDRIIADLSGKAGGDPARVAVGYFSGPGNIAPPGSPNPWKEDRRDGNGKSTSAYVGEVMARLQPTNAAQRDAAVAGVRRDLADAPLSVRLRAETQVIAHFSHIGHQEQQERAVLHTDIKDLSASYGNGSTGTDIPDAKIRRLFPGEEGQRIIDDLILTRSAGDAVHAAAYASPDDGAAMRAYLAGNPTDPRMAGERQHAVSVFDQAMHRNNQAADRDPAGYAGNAPEVQALRQSGAPLADQISGNLAVQTRIGIAPSRQRIMSATQTETIAEMLRTTGPEKADMMVTLNGVAAQFGVGDKDPMKASAGAGLWNRAYGELVQHGKIDQNWQAIAGMSLPEQADARAKLQLAIIHINKNGGPASLLELIPHDQHKEIGPAIEAAMLKFKQATLSHPGGSSLFAAMKNSVETLTKWNMSRGLDATKSAVSAYEGVIGARFDTAGDDGSSIIRNTPTFVVPKGEGGRIEAALGQVVGVATAADLQALPGDNAGEATLAAFQKGIWINSRDGSGVVRVGSTVGGNNVHIFAADGKPIEVSFAGIPAKMDAGIGAAPSAVRPPDDGRDVDLLQQISEDQLRRDTARQARRAVERNANDAAPAVDILQQTSQQQVLDAASRASVQNQNRGWAEQHFRKPDPNGGIR